MGTPTLRKTRGILVPEAIIAMVMLIAGFVIVALLFHRAIQFGNMTYQRQLGAFLAEREMETLRGWAAQTFGPSSTTQFSDDGEWTSRHVTNQPIAGHPGYNVTITSEFVDLSVPCSSFAGGGSGFDTTLMPESIRRVEVTVVSSRETFEQVSYIGDPVVDLDTSDASSVTVSGGGGVLSQDATTDLTCTVTDSAGRVVEDVMVKWYVEPESDGGGTIIAPGPPSLANTCTFIHRVDLPPPETDQYFNGVTTRIVARVRVEGREMVGYSAPITLVP